MRKVLQLKETTKDPNSMIGKARSFHGNQKSAKTSFHLRDLLWYNFHCSEDGYPEPSQRLFGGLFEGLSCVVLLCSLRIFIATSCSPTGSRGLLGFMLVADGRLQLSLEDRWYIVSGKRNKTIRNPRASKAAFSHQKALHPACLETIPDTIGPIINELVYATQYTVFHFPKDSKKNISAVTAGWIVSAGPAPIPSMIQAHKKLL